MQRHLYQGVLAALAASIAVTACDQATASPTVQATQSSLPGYGFSVSANSANSGHTITFTSNGSFASSNPCVSTPDGLTITCLDVSAQKGGTPSAQTTFLFYDLYTCTWDPINYWYTCSDTDVGSGLIPNSDFSDGGGQMRLRTNTQADPDFVVYRGSGGLIDVTFRKTNLFTSSGESNFKDDFGTYSEKENSHSTVTSDLALGTVLGTPLNDPVYSTMGTQQGTSIYHISH